MCLMIHKPPYAVIPESLIRIARAYDGGSSGLMGIGKDRRLLLERRHRLNVNELLVLEPELRGAEYVLHLCQPRRDDSVSSNVYPFEVTEGIYLMHSGALRLKARVPGKSDTWHLVHDLLRPLVTRWDSLFEDPSFAALWSVLEEGLRPDNRLALLGYPRRRFIIINREHRIDILWRVNLREVAARQPRARPSQAGRSSLPAAAQTAGIS